MNEAEFSKIASAIRTYYPKEKILPNDEAMGLWYAELKDVDYRVCGMALRKWVATNKWSPSIADLREYSMGITQGEPNDWGKEWESVMYAIRRYGMYREEDALNSFDELTRQCVQRLGWKTICTSENISSERANFRMIYEQVKERSVKNRQIPASVQALTQKMLLRIEGGYE